MRRTHHADIETRTLLRAAEKLNGSRAPTRTNSVMPMHPHSHAHHTHTPLMHSQGHDVLHILYSLVHPSWALSIEIRPFHHLSCKEGAGTPNSLLPLALPAPFQSSPGSSVAGTLAPDFRPGRSPLFGPPAAPPLTLPQLQQLLRRTVRGASTGAAAPAAAAAAAASCGAAP